MKVLFVSSGNNKFGISPIVFSQGESLKQNGVEIDYLTIKGKGLLGYIKNIPKIKSKIKCEDFKIIHAHYSLSGWSVVLSVSKKKIPIILSLMGSDAYGEYIGKEKISFSSLKNILLTLLIQPFVSKIICKSKNIENFIYLKKKSVIIPNGIDLNNFKPSYDRSDLRRKIGFNSDLKYILFLGDKNDLRKNYSLAFKSINLINSRKIILINPYPLNHTEVSDYLNATDILVHTSFAEGSPNVIKEAMACNLPVVSTNVGDVRWLFGNEPGYYICSFDPRDVAEKIRLALDFAERQGRTNGRNRIIELGLDSDSIALKIISVYQSVLLKN